MNALQGLLGFASTLLLVGAAVGVVCGWVASVLEVAKVRDLDPGVFGAGPVVLRFDLLDLPAHAATREPVRVAGGRFRVLASGRILFTPRVYLPLPGVSLLNFGLFKGSIDRVGGVPRVSARATVGGTILLASFGVAAGVLGAAVLTFLLGGESCSVSFNGRETTGAPACRIGAALLVSVGAILGSAVWGGVALMRRRARRLALEVRTRLVEASAGRTSLASAGRVSVAREA